MPKTAICVYKGVLHDIYQLEQVMFDGTVATFEAIRRNPSVTVIAVTPDEKIIINKEQQTYYGSYLCLPGGISETNNLLDDVKRELKEETGYTSDDWVFYDKTDILQYSKMEWESHSYVAKKCIKTGSPALDSGELITVQLCNFYEFLKITQSPAFNNSLMTSVVKNLINNQKNLSNFKDILGIT